jgi:hypothetical protein
VVCGNSWPCFCGMCLCGIVKRIVMPYFPRLITHSGTVSEKEKLLFGKFASELSVSNTLSFTFQVSAHCSDSDSFRPG